MFSCCGNCRFFHMFLTAEGYGTCRARPPERVEVDLAALGATSPTLTDKNDLARWPLTVLTDVCGAHSLVCADHECRAPATPGSDVCAEHWHMAKWRRRAA
jgi:hypothetical protein